MRCKIEAIKTEYGRKVIIPTFFMEDGKLNWNAETYGELKSHPGREAVELCVVRYTDNKTIPELSHAEIIVKQDQIPQLVRSAIMGGSISLGSDVIVTEGAEQSTYKFHNHYTLTILHDNVSQ